MTRRVIPLGITPGNPVALPSIIAPTLSITNQTTSTLILVANYIGPFPAVSKYVFQSSTGLGGPFSTIANQSGNSFSTSAPAQGIFFYYRVAVIVSDGRQSDWSAISSVVGIAPATGRRYAGGHYVALAPAQINGAGDIPNAGNITTDNPPQPVLNSAPRTDTGPVSANVKALVVRFNMGEINPTGTTYDFSRMDREVAQCGTFKNGGVLFFPMIIIRTFNGSVNYTFTSNRAGTTSGTLNSASSAAISPGKYGLSFDNGDVRNNVTVAVSGSPPVATMSWTGALSATATSVATFNLMSNSPLPDDIAAFAECFIAGTGNTSGGWQTWRWSPTYLNRFNAICTQIGNRYDNNPFFGGIATQETSAGGPSGGSAGTYTVGNYTGSDNYTPDGYLAGLNAESDSISNHCLHARHLAYQNALSGGEALLLQYAAHIQPNGAIYGGPDLVLGGGLTTGSYQRLKSFHNGTSPVPAPGPTFQSMQTAEWSNDRAPAISPPASPEQRFNYARGFTAAQATSTGFPYPTGTNLPSPLNLDIIVWDWHQTGTYNFTQNAVPLFTSTPTFGTFTP